MVTTAVMNISNIKLKPDTVSDYTKFVMDMGAGVSRHGCRNKNAITSTPQAGYTD